jgi:hypothetical protein
MDPSVNSIAAANGPIIDPLKTLQSRLKACKSLPDMVALSEMYF